MSETRKLVAILVADVVGYSRLVGADEDRTLARLRSRDLIKIVRVLSISEFECSPTNPPMHCTSLRPRRSTKSPN
jgi:hypothetical protein